MLVGWMPCSGLESVDGLVWIKRMVQKARRQLETRASGTDLMDGYLFGNNDFIDAKVLKFLGVGDDAVLRVAAAEPGDEPACRRLIAASGRSPEECAEFSRRLRRSLANFAVLEADEGRRPSGMGTSALRFFYNRMLMPIAYLQFRAAERRRAARAGRS